jgi:(2Fe-2S) ferredoxin
METTWDGGVLEISIADGAFQDIITAGGTFITGGYTNALNASTNPLGSRFAWSGATQIGFLQTSVRLPSNAFGQSVRFRWRFGTNDSFGGLGWWIDTVTVESIPSGANTNSIVIPTIGTANSYPSEIQVSGLNGLVTGVSVGLENFSHLSSDDVDILLVAPNGRSVLLMSDVGGNTFANDIDLTLTDAAANSLPDNSALSSGVFKPTNFDNNDTFPSPAPQMNYGANLASLYGSNPNGTWQLFVVDDTGENAGAITGGWNLDIKTSVNACLFSLDPIAASFPNTGGAGDFDITIPAGCGWTATINNSFISFSSTPSNTISGTGSGTVNYNVAENFGAARTGLITVTDGFNPRTFQIQQGSGCPFSLAQTNLNFSSNGGSGNVSVTAGAGCVWNGATNANWIQITSQNQTGNGNLTFNVLPNTTGAARSANITVGARTLTVNQSAENGGSTKFDFDGDGRADVSVFRESIWYLLNSTNGFSAVQFGLANDKLVPADYDADGKTDVAVFRNGVWYILRSSDNVVQILQFGQADDKPVPADYTGDGRAELAVFRDGVWLTQNLNDDQINSFQFGLANDKPVPADFDADGKTDYAVYREGVWYIQRSTNGFFAAQFGLANDIPVVGDYDGNDIADIAVYRDGIWYQLLNLQTFSAVQFGLADDLPVQADYDGDGKLDIAIFRQGTWYILRSSDAQVLILQFGLANDTPVPNAFVP